MDQGSRGHKSKPRGRTGPRTSAGRARSSKNALRHGLSVPITADPNVAAEVTHLARTIVGDDHALMGLALRIAEAQLDLIRIRRLRAAALAAAFEESSPFNVGRPTKTKQNSEPSPKALFWEFVHSSGVSVPQGLLLESDQATEREKPAAELGPSRNLVSLGRYERRALSRRKFAIRDFDAARLRREALD